MITALRKKSSESSSKKTSEQDRKEAENHGGDETETVEVPETDGAVVMSVENGTAAKVHVFNVSSDCQVDLCLRTKEIEHPDNPLCQLCL